MVKTEIFERVLTDVCEVTEISERDIMSKSKSEEIVDARHLLVVTLRRSGYYLGMIAERLHVSGRAVRKMIGSFRSRSDNSPGLKMCLRRVEARRNARRQMSGDLTADRRLNEITFYVTNTYLLLSTK